MERWQLQQMQGLDLSIKIEKAKLRIREWYDYWEGKVYVSFSGGKDSTVLLNLVRSMYPDVPAVFVDTGLEFPEVRTFVNTFENVEKVRPEIPFNRVIKEKGYPVASKKVARAIRDLKNPTDKNVNSRNLYLTGFTQKGKKSGFKLAKKWLPLIDAPFKVSEQCCDYMKKKPFKAYEKATGRKPYIGTMAHESGMRQAKLLEVGCNSFGEKGQARSAPMSVWLEQDVLRYLLQFDVPFASVYGEIAEDDHGMLYTTGERRTGCVFCLFGVDQEKGENRIQRLKRTHPNLWKYCMRELGTKEVMEYIKVPYE